MNKIFFTLLLFFIYGSIFSQNGRKLNENEKHAFEQKIVEYSKTIQTIQCAFVQEKTSTLVSEKSVAKGIMLYQAPSKLRWEYTELMPSTLILTEKNAVLLDKNGNKTGNEKMLKQLGELIISMINGKGIAQNRQFSSMFYEINQTEMLVVLTPVQKRLKDMYQKIELKMDQKTMLANEIILHEKNGDFTHISFSNTILNSEISPSKFAIQ